METAAAPVDLLVVGAGPVGLACALEAARQGLSHVMIEKGALLDTLVHFPTYTIFFSTPELLEIGGHPFATASGKPTRREGLVYYRKVAEREGLEIRLHERVLSVERGGDLFRVTTTKGVHAARAVVLATGFYAALPSDRTVKATPPRSPLVPRDGLLRRLPSLPKHLEDGYRREDKRNARKSEEVQYVRRQRRLGLARRRHADIR